MEVSAPAAAATATAGTGSTDVEAEQSDLLQNLLGVSDAQALDKMLDSADSAAALLGVEPTQDDSKSSTPATDDA